MMFNKINNYLDDKRYKMIIYEDSIYITNYSKILSLESNYISLLTHKKKIILNGSNLVFKKIVDKEILIRGDIFKIEVIDVQ